MRRKIKSTGLYLSLAIISFWMLSADRGRDPVGVGSEQMMNCITIHLPGLTDNDESLEMIRVPPGTFIMGSNQKELGRHGHPWPPHEVTISKPFYISKREITQAQYEALQGIKANHSKHKGANNPMEKLSWYDTQLFLRKLNKLGQGRFRLPTEAEWEYACNMSDSLGILDMKSGLCEWCEDRWQKTTPRGPQTDPRNKGGLFSLIWPLTNRVYKGESAGIDPREIAAFRAFEQSIDYHYTIGFRIVREVE
jgi:formylglycine-generating enzyme required for sulfatase activity